MIKKAWKCSEPWISSKLINRQQLFLFAMTTRCTHSSAPVPSHIDINPVSDEGVNHLYKQFRSSILKHLLGKALKNPKLELLVESNKTPHPTLNWPLLPPQYFHQKLKFEIFLKLSLLSTSINFHFDKLFKKIKKRNIIRWLWSA